MLLVWTGLKCQIIHIITFSKIPFLTLKLFTTISVISKVGVLALASFEKLYYKSCESVTLKNHGKFKELPK